MIATIYSLSGDLPTPIVVSIIITYLKYFGRINTSVYLSVLIDAKLPKTSLYCHHKHGC